MKATHRVKDNEGKTVGFIIDGTFVKYYEVINIIKLKLVDNLITDKNGVIKSKRGVLKECKLTDINNQMYTSLHEENNLERDVIDEIQESSRIYNKIRIFQKELRCDVIVTGSYLGATLNNKFFVPMGNLYDIEMLPLSFKEFCRALDLEDELLNISLYGKSNSKSYERLTKAYQGYIESPFLR